MKRIFKMFLWEPRGPWRNKGKQKISHMTINGPGDFIARSTGTGNKCILAQFVAIGLPGASGTIPQ